MKGEKVADASTKTYGSSKMSEFFRHGSVEEKRAVYSSVAIVAIVAISQQKDVIRDAETGQFGIEKCK